jgi:hypothetical protein
MASLRTEMACHRSIEAESRNDRIWRESWARFDEREAARCERIDAALADMAASTETARAQVKEWGL